MKNLTFLALFLLATTFSFAEESFAVAAYDEDSFAVEASLAEERFAAEKSFDEERFVEKVISSGHYSTIEHIQLSFAIRGISRACSHQLVRHRLMSFSQKSQRYVKEIEQFKYIIPSEIEKDPKLKERFEIYMSQIFEMYEYFISKGVKAQDARSVLPNAVETSMVASLNLRELIHLANIRLCSRAQEEIRYLVKEMVSLVNDKYPWLKKHLVPKCESLGFCDEDKSCGRKPIKGS